jgi:uncharacterized damage-inducible protein DinB
MLVSLLQEYKKAAEEYIDVIESLSQNQFEKVIDIDTKDIDCKSIKSITFHVVQSGYAYANYINSVRNVEWHKYDGIIDGSHKGILEIRKMLAFTEELFLGISDKSNSEIEQWEIETSWGMTYDFEQLMEHAIVHVLRHRRQIFSFLKNKE